MYSLKQLAYYKLRQRGGGGLKGTPQPLSFGKRSSLKTARLNISICAYARGHGCLLYPSLNDMDEIKLFEFLNQGTVLFIFSIGNTLENSQMSQIML